MKKTDRILIPRSVGLVFGISAVVILLLIIWAAQFLNIVTKSSFEEIPFLVILSFIFPIAFFVPVAVSLLRFLIQRKTGEPGSRLRLRLIGSFGLIILATLLPAGLFSALFFRTAIDIWLNPANGRALESGEAFAANLYEDSIKRLSAVAESDFLAELLEEEENIGDIWKALKDIAPYLHAVQIIGGGEACCMGTPSLFFSPRDISGGPDNGLLPRRITEEGMALSWCRNIGKRTVILTTLLPESFHADWDQVTEALEQWNRYNGHKGRIGGTLAFFFISLIGPLALIALLIGMALSERIISPLVTLGEATAKITDGDFSFRVLAPKNDELTFLTQSFNRMIRELEVSHAKIVQTEKIAAWQIIAQRLAHELRNPLTPIKLTAQRVQRKALEDQLDADSLVKSMELILREVDGLDKLLQDFRSFAGSGPPQFEAVPLKPLLEEILERFRSVAPSVEWVLVPMENEPVMQADALQLRQAIVNLLKNAMEAGAVKVSVRADMVRRGSTDYARLQVKDDGEGIAPERISSVFHPYDSTKDRGSGLGLAVVQRIIYDHRGRIWLESELGTGTVFYIDLPVKEDS